MADTPVRRHPQGMTTLDTSLVIVVAGLFAGMGLVALVRPAAIWAPFGVSPTTPDSRNEVRAVYGGFGVAVAGLLLAALGADDAVRDGIVLAVATALGGMALGRVVGFAVERPGRWFPAPFFLVVEVSLAAALLLTRS